MIHMQISSDDFEFLLGDYQLLSDIQSCPAFPMFAEHVVDFLADLSKKLLTDRNNKAYVDVMSYAYWIRRASINEAKLKHTDYNMRLGRGVAFHVAPSNVPVNFAVSMTSSLLAGNATIIRVSNKHFTQVDIICRAMNELLEGAYADMKGRICIFRYEHSEEITQWLSDMCDVRVVWGGNHTIHEIRKAELPPRAIELTFADRHSIAVIQAEEYLKADEEEIAKGFYTDTYYTDQNACSSPRLVVWLGSDDGKKKARKRFWETLGTLVERDYDMKPIQAVDKFDAFCKLGMANGNVKLISDNNFIVRVEVVELTDDLMDYKMSGGYFFEYCADNIDSVLPVLTKQCQTISYYGVDKQELKRLVFENGVRGVDRIVPLGQTMGLEFVWEGYKMIEAMARVVYY